MFYVRKFVQNQNFRKLIFVSLQTFSLDKSENFLSEIDRFETKLKGPLSHKMTMHINNLKALQAIFQILMANIEMNGRYVRKYLKIYCAILRMACQCTLLLTKL